MVYHDKQLERESDSELLVLLAKGSQYAYTIIYNRYAPILYIHAERMLADKDLARDVIHDLFAMLWDKHDAMHIKNSLKSYLYQAVRNRVLDVLAKEKVRLNYRNVLLRSGEPTDIPEECYMSKELEKLIDNELNRLPEQMRKVFLLSRVDDKTYRDIAEELDIAEGTVKKQIYLALKRLKKRIIYFCGLIFLLFLT